MYWNDEDLSIEKYTSHKKSYFCGKKLDKYDNTTRSILYTILVLDYGEVTCADVYSDSEVVVLMNKKSNVPGKHKTGGQSAQRMERLRDGEIKLWFKDINRYIMTLDREITLGISTHYYNTFKKHLHTYSKEKIKKQLPCEYSNLSGVYDLINKINRC